MTRRKTLYEIIYKQLENEIRSMTDGTQLPSIEKLCETFGASKTVLREVMAALEKEGMVVRRQGLGTFVVKDSSLIHTDIGYLRGLTKIISSSGKTPSLIHDSFRVVDSDSDVADKLELSVSEKLVVSERVYAADSVPAIFARTYIASTRIPGGPDKVTAVLRSPKSKELTLFDLLEEIFKDPIKYALAEIEAEQIDKNLSGLLKMMEGSPVVVMKEVHRDVMNIPMLYSEDYINTDVFRIHVIRKKI